MEDINFALSLGYPAETRYKLYERLGKCHIKLGNPVKAKPALMIAAQLIKKATDLEETKKKSLFNSIQKLRDGLQGQNQPSNGQSEKTMTSTSPE